jgi:hypothetical protein
MAVSVLLSIRTLKTPAIADDPSSFKFRSLEDAGREWLTIPLDSSDR